MTLDEVRILSFWDNKPVTYDIPKSSSENDVWAKAPMLKEKFIQEGYLRTTTCYENIWFRTVPELKAILAEKELKVSGKKSELVQRIIDNFDDFDIEDMFYAGKYKLTEKGTDTILQNSIYLRNPYGFPFLRLKDAKESYPDATDEEIHEKLLIEDFEGQLRNNSWRTLSATACYLSGIFNKSDRSNDSLDYLFISYHELYKNARSIKFGIEQFRLLVQPILFSINTSITILNLSKSEVKKAFFSAVDPLSEETDRNIAGREINVLIKLLTGELVPQYINDIDIWGREYYEFVAFPEDHRRTETEAELLDTSDTQDPIYSSDDVPKEEYPYQPSKLMIGLLLISSFIVILLMIIALLTQVYPAISQPVT